MVAHNRVPVTPVPRDPLSFCNPESSCTHITHLHVFNPTYIHIKIKKHVKKLFCMKIAVKDFVDIFRLVKSIKNSSGVKEMMAGLGGAHL